MVIAREGLWIIRFHKDWMCKKKCLTHLEVKQIYKQLQKQIKNINHHMTMFSKSNKTIMESFLEYKKQINHMTIKDRTQIFHITFQSWEKNK